MFSTFPHGTPGLALLLLRSTLGLTVLIRGYAFLASDTNPVNQIGGAAVLLCGVSMLTGFLTPLGSLAAAGGGFFDLFRSFQNSGADSFSQEFFPFYIITTALALLLIGPGAISIDARLFGRREIIIPKQSDHRGG